MTLVRCPDEMQGLQVELISCLRSDELHRRTLYRLGNRNPASRATEMMRSDTGLHANQARGIGEVNHATTSGAARLRRNIKLNNVKRVLANIDAE